MSRALVSSTFTLLLWDQEDFHENLRWCLQQFYSVYRELVFNLVNMWIPIPKPYTVKHVYSDHAYNEMTLITKHLGIPGKHSLFLRINFTLTAKLHITKSRL